MNEHATAVIAQPVSVVETLIWDVTTWCDFLSEVHGIRKESHGRFEFELSHRGALHRVPVTMHYAPRHRRFTWHTVDGPDWGGELVLRPMNGRRTRVTLNAGRLPGGPSPDRESDLARLIARYAHLPQPVRPTRWSVDDERMFGDAQAFPQWSGPAETVFHPESAR